MCSLLLERFIKGKKEEGNDLDSLLVQKEPLCPVDFNA